MNPTQLQKNLRRGPHPRAAGSRLSLALALPALLSLPTLAHAQNIEDEPIPDDVPAAVPPARPAPGAPATAPGAPATAPGVAATNPGVAATNPGVAATNPGVAGTAGASDNITVPRAVWEKLLRDVEDLKRGRGAGSSPASGSAGAALPGAPPSSVDDGTAEPSAGAPNAGGVAPVSTEGDANSSGNRNYLLLPDISFIGNVNGALSSDRRQERRGTLRFTEGEIGIQGSVYPNVNVNAFIVASPVTNEPFQVEEGNISFVGIRKNLNVILGRKFVPFGRSGEQHPHSWLYARQLLPRRSLLAEENIVGDGALFRYLLPTGKFYTNLDVGVFTGGGAGQVSSSPFGNQSPQGPGASFTDRFTSARLWSGVAVGERQELEAGLSYAAGRAQVGDELGTALGRGRNTLSGVDLSFRRFMGATKRLLLRTEYFGSNPSGGLTTNFRRANGYYGLANYRFDKFNDIGLLYENSGFPQISSNGAREKDLSLILTRQFTEQFYTRLHLTRGDSPGHGGFNAAFLQFVFGIGPHTHNLE